jgi:hypothetical protein
MIRHGPESGFPQLPHAILDTNIRWFAADEACGARFAAIRAAAVHASDDGEDAGSRGPASAGHSRRAGRVTEVSRGEIVGHSLVRSKGRGSRGR